jgi:methionyl-tRNA formyltransferase
MGKNSKDIKIVFMGTSSFADIIFSSLIRDDFKVISLFTQPDKKAGRKQEIKISPTKKTAEVNNIPVFEPERFDETTIELLRNQKPDMVIVASYGKILPEDVLGLAPLGSINVHASLLPKYRGSSPIQNVLLSGEKETGVSIMLMDKGVDSGAVFAQKRVEINPDETYLELSVKLAHTGYETLKQSIELILKGQLKPKPQDESQITLCQLIEREDGKIFWSDDAETIYNRWRAFLLWPGIFSYWENKKVNYRLKFVKITTTLKDKSIPDTYHIGQVIKQRDSICVIAESGLIQLHIVQLEGKKPMEIQEFVNGYPNFIGSILK